MKKKSPPYAIIGAVVLGLIAMLAFFSHEKALRDQAAAALAKAQHDAEAALAAERGKAPPPPIQEVETHMRPVLFATQPIDAGVRISPSFFEQKNTPEGLLPDAYTKDNMEDVIGSFAVRHIEKGDALSPRNVGKTLPFMSGRISPGMRAVALQVYNGESNRTGGFVIDGDKVDLLATTTTATGDFFVKTEMVMQNVDVLYVPGPTIRTDKTEGVPPMPSPGGSVSVTFEVTPEQAQALIALSSLKNVKIYMILRSREDKSEVKIKPFAAEDYDEGRLSRIQRMTDNSYQRVMELQKQIQAEEAQAKNQGQQGNTNATPKPASP